MEVIGRGGMSVVWRAHDQVLDRIVALKELTPGSGLTGHERNVMNQRMQREARASAQLRHANVVTVHDVLIEADRSWIVMEYVQGETLQDLLDRVGPLPSWRVAEIGLALIGPLREAHQAGILHRDIKPSNVMLAEDGRILITDFGIAQVEGDTALTQTGLVIGSPAYIPPERVQGERAVAASDLWSLGATLYTAVEGRSPYERADTIAMLTAVLTEPAPPPLNAGDLAPVLLGMLEREPPRRPSLDEAEWQLTKVAAIRPGTGSVPGTAGRYRLERQLGGAVWLARDEGETVAVRVVPADSAPYLDAARMLREVRPHGVISVVEVGDLDDGRGYVAMEHAGLPSLAARAEFMSPEDVFDLTAMIARRVTSVNEVGLHFRRLEPSDVLFQRSGQDDRQMLLGLPSPDADGDLEETRLDRPELDSTLDVRALGEFAVTLLGRPLSLVLTDEAAGVIGWALQQRWDNPASFADALEAVRSPALPAPTQDEPEGAPLRDGQLIPPPGLGLDPTPADGWSNGPDRYSGYPPAPYGPPRSSWTGQYGQPPLPAQPAPFPMPYPSQDPDRHPTEGIPAYPSAPASPPTPRIRPRRWRSWRGRRPVAPPSLGGATSPDGLRQNAHSYALYTPLNPPFQYVHEPLRLDDDAIPMLGNERLIRALKERLVNSRGGTFLVTGFRGVGKTTLVERALAEIAAEHPRTRKNVLPIVLSVARPMAVEKLLFAVVRRIFEELTEARVLETLDPATRQSLLLAYMRTSLSFKETRSDSSERATNVEFDPSKLSKVLRPVGLMVPKAGVSTKRSRSLATEAAFLAYSETDVEHDMMRIIRMLSTAATRKRPRRVLRWRRSMPYSLQLVVVLDELDKLTALQNGLEEVERLLSGIKNVVTMRGAHYLFVAGPDLHDRVLKESGRGNSIYESIFAWQLYVPCNWAAPSRLLKEIVVNTAEQADGITEEFEQYLRFKSRGVLRRLLHELNSFVVWDDMGMPFLRIGSGSYETISFYARIERSLDAFFVATQRDVLPNPIDQDRWRLGAYYVMDWILRSEGRPFGSADVMNAVNDGEFDSLLRISQSGVDMLLEHLALHRVLDVVRQQGRVTSTLIVDVAQAGSSSYRLESSLLGRLLSIVQQDEQERAELDYGQAAMAGSIVPIRTVGNRYELHRLIGEGGTSTVYEGKDLLLQRPVAVKMLRSALTGDQRARMRFLREARIAEGMHHPNVVDVYEVVTLDGDGGSGDRQYAIVMEYIAAPTLREQLLELGPLPAKRVVQLGVTLAGALDYLAGKGLARLDLKPHNIVMSRNRGPVIIDLGIAKIIDEAQGWLIDSESVPDGLDMSGTQTNHLIGTPAYMAPEQLLGELVDIRADLFALGLVLYTSLMGTHPYPGADPAPLFARILHNDLDTSGLPCSPELRAVIAKATARDRWLRHQTPAELRVDLLGTPEAKAT
jgi:serine/threonine-protein kinase